MTAAPDNARLQVFGCDKLARLPAPPPPTPTSSESGSAATEVRLEWLRVLGLGSNLGDDDVACEGDGMIKGGSKLSAHVPIFGGWTGNHHFFSHLFMETVSWVMR